MAEVQADLPSPAISPKTSFSKVGKQGSGMLSAQGAPSDLIEASRGPNSPMGSRRGARGVSPANGAVSVLSNHHGSAAAFSTGPPGFVASPRFQP